MPMLVNVSSAALQGVEAMPVQIEVHISRGFRFSLVGLPDNAVKESHERIVSALQVNGMDFPRKQIVINMSPADLRKEGTAYDLPLLVGMMAAGEYIPASGLESSMFVGELALDGRVKPIRGVLSIAILAKTLGISTLVVPLDNAPEAQIIEGIQVVGIDHVINLRKFLHAPQEFLPLTPDKSKTRTFKNKTHQDFSDVRGQEQIKRAVEVACAGGHNILMIGPPGAGKSMIANCIPGILPPMGIDEAIETTRIHSISGTYSSETGLIRERPFRSPHHSISAIAMAGGGNKPQPGEISLAHHGVLFLDELPEFNRSTLEILRQPLEEGRIHISRVRYAVEFPAKMMLVASMNPCPCGYYNHPNKECICTPGQRFRYKNKISGPLLDRIDIQTEIQPVTFEKMNAHEPSESSLAIRERIISAREIQTNRYKNSETLCNANMSSSDLNAYVTLDSDCTALLKKAMQRLQLSARAYTRILKVARTIADLSGDETVKQMHIAEAIQYRAMDREKWGQ